MLSEAGRELFISPRNNKGRNSAKLQTTPPQPQSNCEDLTAHWLSSTACSADQQGSAKLNSVDIDRRGESGESSRQLHRWQEQEKMQTEEVH